MSAYSMLYLGRGDTVASYLAELETLPCCSMLSRSAALRLPEDAPYSVDLVLLEVGPAIAQSGQTLPSLIRSLAPYPVVALTTTGTPIHLELQGQLDRNRQICD